MENDIPSEAEMGALFEAAMRQQQKATKAGAAPKVTQEEQHKFLSAMKDAEFRSLLNEYMQEISDPRNRAETEQYLAQLENEQKVPTDKQLVKPTPGFVIKTKWEASQKICQCVQQRKDAAAVEYQERLEPDKGGSSVPTFDVCFHPRVIEFAMSRGDYRHMAISTCLDAVEPILRETRRKPKALLARNYHILKGVFYKSGDPVTMCLKKERDAPEPAKSATKVMQSKTKSTSRESGDKIAVLGDEKNALPLQTIERVETKPGDSVLSELTHVEQNEKSSPLIKEVSSTKLDAKQQIGKRKKEMEHQLIYRGRFELLHHMQADPGKNVPEDRHRPKELVIEISFPLSSSAKGLDLDVSERMVRLSAGPDVPGNYEPLELALPFPVIEDKGTAKFDRKNHKLVVTLPVQPPPTPKPQSVSLIFQDEDEDGEQEEVKREETALMVANDPQVLAYAQRKARSEKSALSTRPSPTVITEPAATKDDIFDDLPPLESCSDEEEEIDTTANAEEAVKASPPILTAAANPVSEIKDVAEPIQPPFETHATDACLSYIVGVAGIASASVKLTFPTTSSLKLRFSDSDGRVYEMQVAVLPIDVEPSSAEFDVASENMVVILQKKFAPDSASHLSSQ
ncbi:Protein kintoun [Phytophthora ramorum]|uniref:Protein kintoun n=1 Tax=Phytophthora ramorum TaxID=164328 RepID=UPI00309E30C1|nr:Protein kintoun [Phytophthora ramorum]